MQYIFVYFTDQNLSIGYDETVFEIARNQNPLD